MPDHKDTVMTVFKIDGIVIDGLDLDSVPVPDGDTDSKKVTTQGKGYVHRNALNMFDPGECEYSGNEIPGDPGQQALDAAFRDRSVHIFQCILTESGIVYEYPGQVAKHTPTSDDNTAKFEGKIVATDIFTRAVSYAAVSKIEATTGTVIPGTAAIAITDDTTDVVIIEPTATIKDTIKVTAATASYIAYTLDDRKTWIPLKSGTASADITLGAAGTVKKAILKIEETDKATRFINVFFARS
jgi:hypothetical protein